MRRNTSKPPAPTPPDPNRLVPPTPPNPATPRNAEPSSPPRKGSFAAQRNSSFPPQGNPAVNQTGTGYIPAQGNPAVNQTGTGYIPAHAKKTRPPRRKSPIPLRVVLLLLAIGAAIAAALALFFSMPPAVHSAPPDELTEEYFSLLGEGRYDEMYSLVSEQSKGRITAEKFVEKLTNVYSGIEAENIAIEIEGVSDYEDTAQAAAQTTAQASSQTTASASDETRKVVDYSLSMDTAAGTVTHANQAVFTLDSEGMYRLEWSPHLILPSLSWDDKIRVNTIQAERGAIYDRNGGLLAGKGTASSVGFVPGKMQRTEEGDGQQGTTSFNADDIARVAELLGLTPEGILEKLQASYVTDDTFVLLKTIPEDDHAAKDGLLTVPGILISDTAVRYYPLGEKASHLTGYVQNISAEELEARPGQGYSTHSVLGKAGLEQIYEDQLRAVDGCEIVIIDENDEVKEAVALRDKVDGSSVTTTIDANMQVQLYDLFSEDRSCSVAMDPKTGEVLALASTPTYDANDFILGMSADTWNALNDNPNQPLYNRFQAALCPGSTMKPITAAAALETGAVSPSDDLGQSGLTWQKDASWGDYRITTTMEYSGPANIENALKFSDNIFFAKTALLVGADRFAQELTAFGFEETIPFEYGLYSSTLSSTESFDSEIQLADSGYGQGQILTNPVHLATLYASFINEGNLLKPRLLHQAGQAPELWKEGMLSPETASTVREDLIQVIESGSSTDARVPGRILGGKTGTAEIKQSVDDVTGTELGWFAVFTADDQDPNPLLVVSMVEDVKGRGGSHYVSQKVSALFG